MKLGQYAALTAMAVAAAIGLAGPASADWTDGSYAYIDTDPDSPAPGSSLSTWVVSSCGAGCKHADIAATGGHSTFHLDGNTWSQTDPPLPAECTYTIDNVSLAATSSCQGMTLHRQLTKNN